MSDKKKIYNIILKAAIAAGFILVFWFIWYYHYREDKAGQIVLKSRYTFSVRIDSMARRTVIRLTIHLRMHSAI